MTRTILVALLALVPALALAQGPAGISGAMPGGPAGARPPPVRDAPAAAPASAPADAESPPADDGSLGIAPLEASAQGGDETRAVPPPDTYTVRPGDTLWDLSGRFLNNPWYWPKIWSYNPEISNPHWIYPGNLLKFFPAADEGPGRVEPVPGAVAAAEEAEEAEPVEGVRELEDFSRADMKMPAPVEQSDAVAVAGPYKIGYVSPRSRFARRDTFITPRELAESGAISGAFEEKLMLSTLDRAYAKFERPAGVKVGETYVVYKTERPIYHPVTNELFGYQSAVLGAAKVVAVDDRAATLVIGQTLEPIERGAMLGPWTQKLFRPVERKPNRASLDGRIIGAQVDVVTMMGEHHVVFLDKGEKDGVEEGNVLAVVRSGDLYGRNPRRPAWDPKLPPENVGALLVVDVKERASAALVTRSMSELMVGDRVEMRPDAN
jgi:hypothetical protein